VPLGLVCVCVLLVLLLSLVGNMVPLVQSSTVDLNALLKSKFDEYLAWITRYTDINGTVVDIRDYSQCISGDSGITLSVPIYLLALACVYEQTNGEFYLALLREHTDAIIDNAMNYVEVGGVGEIFFATHCWIGHQGDTNVHQTAIMGIVATKLYLWTGETSYKTLADRIATESYDKLAVLENSTDLAWSTQYYQERDEENAKRAINRQGMMAWFYALYGKHVNSTFTPLVPKIVNWMWRAQINDGGLGYNIGDPTVNTYYSAMSIYEVLNAYVVDSSQFNPSLRTKIANALVYIHDRCPAPYDYQRLYFLTSAFVSAWKTDYFTNYIDVIRTKSMLYSALSSFHLTDIGFVSRIEHLSFGFRWQQYAVVPVFMAYPLADPTFDTSTMNPITSYEYATGFHYFVGYTGGISSNFVTSGRDYCGVRLHCGSDRKFYMHNTTGSPFNPLPVSMVTNNTYFVKTTASYGSPSDYVVKLYSYPVGVHVGEVTGSGSGGITLRLDDSVNWKVAVENGSVYQINSFTNPQSMTLGSKIMVWLNTTSLTSRQTFFIKAPVSEWRIDNTEYLFLRFNQLQTNFRVVFIELCSWGDIITDQTEAFSTLGSIADTFDTTQPMSYDMIFNAYHNNIAELQADASWKTLYESAQSSTVKLVGHSLPEEASLETWNYNNEKLAFTVSAPTGILSTTDVYVDNKGEPTSVSGAASWDYDSVTKILTITVMHSDLAHVTVEWLLGDVNGDGAVDVNDLTQIGKAYGAKPGDSNWDDKADINKDAIVEIYDLATCASNYGKE